VISRTIDLGGPIHYVDHGGSGPPMVLVHGLGGSHVNWCAVAPALARRHRVLAIDLPGFGRTPLGSHTTKLDDNAALIAQFIAHVAGGRATLVGNSMGGLLSMMTAARYPYRVDHLVLVNAAHPPVRGMPIDREVALVFAMYMMPWVGELVMLRRAKMITPEQLVHETMRVCAAEPKKLSREIIEAHIAIATERRSMDWAPRAFLIAARSIVRALSRPWRIVEMADRIKAPTLVIHGDRDRLVPHAAARAAAARRNWRIEVLPNIGHVPQLEAPQRFVELVESFVSPADVRARAS
jgi:pimeloyl-ACP methyl ester carboxylesterase